MTQSDSTPIARVARARVEYPRGTRVELIDCCDPYTKLRRGERGTVSFVDDLGTVHVDWDSGSKLGIVPDEDAIRRVAHDE